MLLLTACGNAEQSSLPVVENSGLKSPTEQAAASSPTERTDTDNHEADAKKETGEMTTIQIIINGQEFETELYDNEAAHQFREMLPLQLDMEDLHDNEKYFYFSDEFKTEDQKIEEIQEGDLMIYGGRCLVLFYENFETKTVTLNSGYEMPIYGIGTYSLLDEECVSSVSAALENGVRLIDTAYMYHNDVICCEV